LLKGDLRLRWALAFLFLLCLLMGLMLPKIWIVSPEDFDPEVRVSGLDLMQSASLRRSALRMAESGKSQEAGQAWLSSLANHPVDERNLEGMLTWLSNQPDLDKQWLMHAWRRGSLLMQLSGTNQVRVELLSRIFQRYEMHDWIIQHLKPYGADLSLSGQKMLVHSLFESRRFRDLEDYWTNLDDLEDRLDQDEELAMYHAAWQAGWGPVSESRSGFGRLRSIRAKAASTERKIAALQMELAVLATRFETENYNRLLDELVEMKADRVRDHVRLWMLFHASGKKDYALKLIANHVRPPSTEQETELMVGVMNQLGLTRDALDLLLDQLRHYPYSPRLWPLAGRLMIKLESWDELRTFAPRMRTHQILRETLEGYAYYLEGIAEHHRGIESRARQHFGRMLTSQPFEPLLTLDASLQLQRIGYPIQAGDLLRTLEGALGERMEFWKRMAHMAHDARQDELVLMACRRAWELEPRNLTLANNFAAALILNRSDPSEAIGLTLDLITRIPDSKVTRINHALALLQNARHEEALQLLRSVPLSVLSPEEKALWHLGTFEGELRDGESDRALAAADKIDLRHLFPVQINWLNEERNKLMGVMILEEQDRIEPAE
jgi:tetratricopeptide (TPR) repeat protein